MASHKNLGGLKLSVSAPFRFTKRPSAFNRCVGMELRGSKPGMHMKKKIKISIKRWRSASNRLGFVLR